VTVTALCVAVALGLVLGISTGSWIVGLIVGIGVGAAFDERMRRQKKLPARRALNELGRKRRPPGDS